jgi:hypothetical protein
VRGQELFDHGLEFGGTAGFSHGGHRPRR